MDKLKSARAFRALGALAVVAALGAASVVLYRELGQLRLHEILARARAYPPGVVAAAAALAALNYLALTCFDALGLRFAGASLAWPKVAFTSFVSYVFSNNVGLSIFGSAAVRYRFYSAWGLPPRAIAKIVGYCVVGFWIGLCSLGGIALAAAPAGAAGGLPLLRGWSRPLGVALLGLVAAYLLLSFLRPRLPRIKGEEISLPSPPLALGHVLVGCLDWLLAAGVLFVLLPAGSVDPLRFLAVYMFAQLAGTTSHVPGGLGVFETVVVLSLAESVGADRLMGALVMYRLVYYLLPLAAALAGFVAAELLRARGRLSAWTQAASRVVAPAMPNVVAALAFLGGVVLLLSSATPSPEGRLRLLGLLLPLPVVELSHFASSLAGLGLLLLAEALARRINAAWLLVCLLLALGSALALLKGLHYEESLVLLALLGCVLPMRRLFHRRAAILSAGSDPAWLPAAAVVLVCAGWLGFFAWKHVEYSGELWWRFELDSGAPRFLRAALGVSLAGLVVFGRRLLSPARRSGGLVLEDREPEIRACLGADSTASANLALLGDKRFRLSEDGRAFIMYAYSGKSAVAMGDPVGDESAFQDLAWSFMEEEVGAGRRPVFYEISDRHLPIYLELGMSLLKTGERARVPLGDFGLEGGRRAKLRAPLNKMLREGFSFRVLEGSDRDAALPDLARVSASWLGRKRAREKGFSLGRFDEAYLRNFPCAVVEKEGSVVAFCDVWSSGDGAELAIDLMRHDAEAPNGVMEFLFTNLMLWGRNRGFRRFDLGIAPMSGLRQGETAPIWNKALSLLYHTGERLYNFKGLRRYKDKYDPEWSPVYLAARGRISVPAVAADIALLVSRSGAPSR